MIYKEAKNLKHGDIIKSGNEDVFITVLSVEIGVPLIYIHGVDDTGNKHTVVHKSAKLIKRANYSEETNLFPSADYIQSFGNIERKIYNDMIKSHNIRACGCGKNTRCIVGEAIHKNDNNILIDYVHKFYDSDVCR